MGATSSSVTPLTITPRYKDDADKAWVTREGLLQMSVWLSPRTAMTLEDIALLIERFAADSITQQVQQQSANSSLAATSNIKYQGRVNSMTFRGQIIDRSQMPSLSAQDYLKEGENFNMLATQNVSVCCVIV